MSAVPPVNLRAIDRTAESEYGQLAASEMLCNEGCHVLGFCVPEFDAAAAVF